MRAYAVRSMHRRVRKLPEASAAYIAGLVDGEGTVTLTRLHAHENRRIVVSIANTEIAILRFVHDEIGAGKITRKRTISVKHTPSFCYALTSRQALELLAQIVDHLRSYKRRRAEFALAHYLSVTPRNGKYDQAMREARESFESQFLGLVAPRGDVRA